MPRQDQRALININKSTLTTTLHALSFSFLPTDLLAPHILLFTTQVTQTKPLWRKVALDPSSRPTDSDPGPPPYPAQAFIAEYTIMRHRRSHAVNINRLISQPTLSSSSAMPGNLAGGSASMPPPPVPPMPAAPPLPSSSRMVNHDAMRRLEGHGMPVSIDWLAVRCQLGSADFQPVLQVPSS